MHAYHAAIRRTEEHLMNAWPSLRTIMCDGWVFREANGYTKRANSAAALETRGAFAFTLRQAERFYAAFGCPTIFRLTPLAGDEPDRILAERGYNVVEETIVMTTPLAPGEAPDPSVRLEFARSGDWENGYADAHELAPDKQRAHGAILDKIAPLPTAFATIVHEGRAVAFGLGVVERDHLGIFDIVTIADARRRGAARKLVEALMCWGAARDAKTAWLSVIGDNEKAKPLYAQLRFRELYRYHYRVSPGA
jgi:N-acetylglutamate synthase